MAENSKDFLVSTADVAFYHKGVLAFTGTTSLNTSIAVSMEDQEVTGGKGNKLLYKYKYGRKLAPSIEFAEWNLAYIAANVGSAIFTGLKDIFKVAECVVLTSGTGTLAKTPVAGTKVFVEKSDGTILEVTPVGSTITVGSGNENVKVTYQYNTNVKRVTIDTESAPYVGRLILTADKHNNLVGKVGEVQIEIPSFQLSGNFDISLETSGSTTTKIDGDALAVEGTSCTDGSVYAYISETISTGATIDVNDIAATPAKISLAVAGTKQLSIVGLKGGVYAPVSIEPNKCTYVSDKPAMATVSAAGLVTGVAAGAAVITVTYNGKTDIVAVTVA